MKFIKLLILSALLSFAFLSINPNTYASSTNRENIINQELDCLSQRRNSNNSVSWGNICYSADEGQPADLEKMTNSLTSKNNFETPPIVVTSEAVPEYNYIYEDYSDEPIKEHSQLKSLSPNDKAFWSYDNLFARENPLTKLEIGFDYYRVTYEEPGLMSDQGNMAGFHSSYTYRLSKNEHIKSLKDIFSDTNKVNMIKIEFDINKGKLDYKSEGTGSDEDIENLTAEIRGLVGYDIPVYKSTLITPYTGVGYRYHNDDSGGRLTTTGSAGYERENKCFYMPLGIETDTKVSENWKFGFNFEYDAFLGGQQISHLEDVGPYFKDADTGLVYALDPVKNEQYSGFGLRASFKVVKVNRSFDLFFQPYVRYWKKKQSDFTQATSDGGTKAWVSAGTDTPITFVEPENKTTEYGIKLGFLF